MRLNKIQEFTPTPRIFTNFHTKNSALNHTEQHEISILFAKKERHQIFGFNLILILIKDYLY